MKYKIILLTVIALFIIGCANYEKEPLTRYSGWVVVEECATFGDEYNYMMYIQKNDSIIKVYTYEYYWKHYKLGDTIK